MAAPTDRDVDRLLAQALPASLAPATAVCVDAERVAAWAEGAISPADAAEIESHLAGCDRCQAMAAAFVRTEPSASAPAVRSPAVVVPFKRRWSPVWLGPIAAAAAATIWFVWSRPVPPSPANPQLPSSSSTVARVEPAPQPPPTPVLTPAPAPETIARSAATATAAKSNAGPAAARSDAGRANELKSPADRKAEAERRADAAPAPAPAPPPPSPQFPPAPPSQAALPAPPAAAGARAAESLGAPVGAPAGAARDAAATKVATVIEIVAAPGASEPAAAQLRSGGAGGGRGGGGAARAVGSVSNAVAAVSRWRIVGGTRLERSSDAGASWQDTTIAIPAGQSLAAGASPGVSICWVAGEDGLVFRSTDGVRFDRLTSPADADLTAIRATSARDASVTTADGRTFVTSDGGQTWRLQGFSLASF